MWCIYEWSELPNSHIYAMYASVESDLEKNDHIVHGLNIGVQN